MEKFPPAAHKVPLFCTPLPILISCLYDDCHCNRCEVICTVILFCIFLLISHAEHLFMCLLAMCMSFLEKCLLRSSTNFQSDCLVVFEFCEFFVFNPLLGIHIASTFSYLNRLPVLFFWIVFPFFKDVYLFYGCTVSSLLRGHSSLVAASGSCSLLAVCGLLPAVASLVVEYRL